MLEYERYLTRLSLACTSEAVMSDDYLFLKSFSSLPMVVIPTKSVDCVNKGSTSVMSDKLPCHCQCR